MHPVTSAPSRRLAARLGVLWRPDFPRHPPFAGRPTLSIRLADGHYRVPASLTSGKCRTLYLLAIAYALTASAEVPTDPGTTAVAQEPSGLRCGWFSHPITLLIPAFALRFAPRVLPRTLLRYSRTLPYHAQPASQQLDIRGFGGLLEPRYVVGAASLDQ